MGTSILALPASAGPDADALPAPKSVPTTPRPATSPASATPPPQWQASSVTWPNPASALVSVASSTAKSAASANVGGLPVKISAADGVAAPLAAGRFARSYETTAAGPAQVHFTVLSQVEAKALGVAGVAFTLTPVGSAGSVTTEIDYSSFAHGYGGNYGRRLRMVRLPACALTEPGRRECRDQAPVSSSRNDPVASTVSAQTDPGPMVFAVTSSSSSDAGDFKATDLSQSMTWSAGSNSGDFTTTVPINTAPVPGSLAPQIALTYSSGSVDGLTQSTNTQAGWAGEGWSLSGLSFVERSYRPCKHDGVPGDVGDLCWNGAGPVSIVLDGHATRLLDVGTGWKAEDDSLGWRVERFTGLAGSTYNGAKDGEYFKVTTMEGTQYFFGYRPKSANGGVQQVEIFGNDEYEPCNVPGSFNASHCTQAYRWNVDKVVDRFGNSMKFNWQTFRGAYGANRNSAVIDYDITSSLESIEYGSNDYLGTGPSARMLFTRNFRCFQTSGCDTNLTEAYYPETPWDQYCAAGSSSCDGKYSPTFWTLYKLDFIESQVWDPTLNTGAGGWAVVDQAGLSHSLPSTGDYISPYGQDDTSPSLWLWKIWLYQRPPISILGARLTNRVFWGNDLGRAPMTHWRINQLQSGTGQTTAVAYSAEECTRTNVYDGSSDRNPLRCFPQWEDDQYRWYHKYVTTDVYVSDTVGGSPTQRWHYDYSTAAASTPMSDAGYAAALWHYDDNWLMPASQRAYSQWRGYTNVLTTHGNGDGTGPQQVSESIFFRGMNGDRTNAGGFGARQVNIFDGWNTMADHEAMSGQVRRMWTLDGRGGTWTNATIHTQTITQTGVMDMAGIPDLPAWRILETLTQQADNLTGSADRWSQVETAYDPTYPLPVLVRDRGDLDATIGDTDDTCTTTSYVTPDLARYFVSFPKQTLTTTCAANLQKADYLAGTQYLYDGSSTLGALGTRADLTKTLVLQAASIAPPAPADWIQGGRSSYDPHGRVLDSFDGLDRKTVTTYTPAQGGAATATSVTTPAPVVGGTGLTTTTTLDPRWGLPTKTIDPNGKVTRIEYDNVGRLIKVWKDNRAPTGTGSIVPDIEYSYVLRDTGPNYISSKTLTNTGAQLESFAVLDGLLRPRRTETVAATGSGRMIFETRYDTVGSESKKLNFYNVLAPNPNLDGYYDKDVPAQQFLVYDNLGRATRDQLWTGNGVNVSLKWETIKTFDGGKVTTTQPPTGGTATTSIADVRGQIAELRQHLGGTPAGAVDVTTRYTYDRLGQLTKVADVNNNSWLYEYDLLGQRTKATDPDAGISTSKYDGAGQVTETVDGNNLKLFYKYDDLGRKTELRDTSASGTLRATWTYDPTDNKGQLASATRKNPGGDFVTTFTQYDDAYRVRKSSTTAPGFATGGGVLTYAIENEYTVNGLLAKKKLPATNGIAAEDLVYSYTSSDHPTTLTSALGTYVNSTTYHPDGLLYRQQLGVAGKQVRLTTDFDAVTRRMSKSWVSTESATPNSFYVPYDYTYGYDNSGNITSAAGNVHGVADQEECFSYDHLQRMTEAWTQISGACTPQRAGADPYRRQWPILDKIGNRKSQVDVDPAGNTTWTYTVGGVDSCGTPSKPHSVTSITATGPKAGTPTRTFCYDAAGNTTKRTSDSGQTQTLAWDRESHLTSVTQGASTWTYLYDTDGSRLVSKAPDGDTLYLPDGTEIKKSGAALDSTRYYTHNGRTIAVRVGTALTWMATDRNGTQQIQITATTLAYSRGRSLPFGETRGTQPTFAGTKGFVGGTKDTTGLTHLGAREYDPTLGRFLSIDPEIDPGDPQTLHGYLYANNSPVTFTDPSGRSWGSFGKGLLKGWQEVNSAPLLFIKGVADTAAAHVEAVTSGQLSAGEAFFSWQNYALDVSVDMIISPVTTAVHGWNAGAAAVDAAQAGDWEAAGQQGYVAAADAACTAMLFIPEAGAFRGGARGATGASIEGATGVSASMGKGLGRLAGREIRVSSNGLARVEQHLAQFGPVDINEAMLARLRTANGQRISGGDASFYMHELAESQYMKTGMSYEAAHPAAFAKYNVSPFSVYPPEIASKFASSLSSGYGRFWREYD